MSNTFKPFPPMRDDESTVITGKEASDLNNYVTSLVERLQSTQEFHNEVMEKLRHCANRHGAPLGSSIHDFVIDKLDEMMDEKNKYGAGIAITPRREG